ncbi:MAG: ASCH domain-containing protein [Candidatus Bathyarchaeota archaeon]|nr:ASCH domain-containing protein [Candidatus Bathyarchaeota archaeon]
MSYSQDVLDFWERAKTATGITGGFTDAWGFGDNPELIDELLGYVKQGIKRTSTSLVKESELEGWPESNVGEYDIILDGRDKPVLVIETVSVRRVKYRDVDAEHAYWEGEDDRTLESYFREHDKYYKRRGEALGFEFNKDMLVDLKRFKIVYQED